MKKSRLLMVWILAAFMLTACAGGQDITTEKTTEQPKEPVIVLGDENLPEPELPEETGNKEEETLSPSDRPEASEKAAPEEVPASQDETDVLSAVDGPVLVIGAALKDAVSESSIADADGGYTETLLCEDGRIYLRTERIRNPFSDYTPAQIQQYFAEKEEWQQVTLAEEDEALSEAVGYPVCRFRYVTGEGEESVLHNMIYVAHDEYGFVLDASAEASDYPDIEALTETWIETVSIFNGE